MPWKARALELISKEIQFALYRPIIINTHNQELVRELARRRKKDKTWGILCFVY